MIPLSKPLIGDAEKQAVLAVLDSGMLAQGERVAALEAKWAAACGVRHAIATTNGTTALHCALLAHGIGPGGEGGMITTSDDALAETCRMLRAHGMQRRYHHEMLGYNFRMTDLHAAVGLAQIERLDALTAQRRANADHLSAHIESVITPRAPAGYAHAWHQYTIRINGGRSRDEAVQQLNAAGVGTGIFYPIPAHRQQHIVQMGLGDVSMPVAEQLAREVISLPVHPLLSQADLDTIVSAVNQL